MQDMCLKELDLHNLSTINVSDTLNNLKDIIPGPSPQTLPSIIISIAFLSIGCLLIVMSLLNITLSLVVIWSERLKTVTRFFVTILSVANVASAVFALLHDFNPDRMDRMHLPPATCSVSLFGEEASKNMKIISLMWIVHERLESVKHPLKRKNYSTSLKLIVASCLFGVAAAAPYAVVFKATTIEQPLINNGTKISFCVNLHLGNIEWQVYCLILVIFRHLISPLAILNTYRYIVAKLMYCECSEKINVNIRKKKKKALLKLLFEIVFIVIFWFPLQMFIFAEYIFPDLKRLKDCVPSVYTCYWLIFSVTTLNPYFYFVIKEDLEASADAVLCYINPSSFAELISLHPIPRSPSNQMRDLEKEHNDEEQDAGTFSPSIPDM